MKKKATVVSYVMQKGGVAKTTTGKNSAEILGKEYKVLAIDNDQNADFSTSRQGSFFRPEFAGSRPRASSA